jgi:hypothetical protein
MPKHQRPESFRDFNTARRKKRKSEFTKFGLSDYNYVLRLLIPLIKPYKMKQKFFLSAIVLTLFAGTTWAQGVEQGKLLIGTSSHIINPMISSLINVPNNAGISIITSKFKSDSFEGDTQNTTAVNLSPTLGACISSEIVVGVDIMLGYFSSDGDAVTLFGAGPFARYYFSGGNVQPFAQINARAGRFSAGDDDEDKVNVLQFGLQGGAAFFVGDNVSIDLFAGFNRTRSAVKDAFDDARDVQNSFGLGAGISVFID